MSKRTKDYLVIIRRPLMLKTKRVINVKDWWPKWLKADWIAKDSSQIWWAHDKCPGKGEAGWGSGGNLYEIGDSLLDINFPDVPWQESKFKNPWSE